MGDTLQFVDSVSATPTVRLDLNDDVNWGLNYDGTDFSPPDLRRAVSQTLLSDGGLVTASAYDNRVVRLRLDLMDSSPDAVAARMQTLRRELNRPTNILKWQPGTTAPQFFLTMRSPINRITEVPGPGTLKQLDVEILAGPHLLGLRETVGGTLNTNGGFESGIGGWTGLVASIAQSNTVARSGTFSLRITPVTGAGVQGARSELMPVTAGLPYTTSAWLYSAAGWASGASMVLDWCDNAGTVLSSTFGVVTAIPAATWTQYTVTGVCPAGATKLMIRPRIAGNPSSTDLVYVDDATAAQYLTVAADPAASINGGFFDVTGIKGDVETPLYLSIPDGSGLIVADRFSCRQSAIAVRRRGTPSAAPFVLQAESMSMTSVDTTVQPNNAVMSGAGSNFVRTTFATAASMVTRISTTSWPSTASVDVRGRYRVYMRYRSSILSPGVMQARLRWGTSNVFTVNDTVGLITGYGGAGGPYMLYADLGDVQFPQGYDPVADGPDGVELPVDGMYIAVDAARISGSASLDIDLLLFVPADDRHLLVAWPPSSSTVTVTLDSDRSQVYAETTAGAVIGKGGAELDGLPPLVSPGVTNRVFFIRDVGQTSSTGSGALGDEITASTVIQPYYWPRYLYARPPSS